MTALWFPEGNTPTPNDDAMRSLQKIVALLSSIQSNSGQITSGTGSPQGVVTPVQLPAIYFDVTDVNNPVMYTNTAGGASDWK